MKKTFLLIIALVLTVGLFAQNDAIQGASVSKYEATQLKNNGNMFIVPLVASLQVAQNYPKDYILRAAIELPKPYKKESEENYKARAKAGVDKAIDELKAQALFEFIDRENCSLIVSPIYSVKTVKSKGLIMNVEVRVKGYPASYTQFRDMRAADSTVVKLNNMVHEKENQQLYLGKPIVETSERTEEIKRN